MNELIFIFSLMISTYLITYSFVFAPFLRRHEMRRQIQKLEMTSMREYNAGRENSLKTLFFDRINKISAKLFKTKSNEKKIEELSQQLYSAGMTISASNYMFILNILTVVAGVLGFLIGMKMSSGDIISSLLFFLIGLIAPYILARFMLKANIKKRFGTMEQQLPDVLDLLSLSVDAGMGFDQALQYVVENMHGPFIDELAVVLREMSLGRTRKDALQHLSEKCGAESITGFTSAVIQSTEMGISMRDVLKMQAKAVRDARVAYLKQKAAKASIKMLIPMVVFIFPVLFIILMGPAAIQSFGNLTAG